MFFSKLKTLFCDAFRTSFVLFRITIPISILTKVLNDFGATVVIGELLGPVMEMIGLPGSMGLVWGTAMLTNLYAGMIVFAAVAPEAGLTVAQVTILTTVMLIAHALPVEIKIAHKAGSKALVMVLLRIAAALFLGWALHVVYGLGNWLQEANQTFFTLASRDSSWGGWVAEEIRNMFYIFLIILLLLAVMRILEHFGIMEMINRSTEPLLRALGMSPKAAPITVVGMSLGLSYGGALIIQEARSGRLGCKDVFISLALMGLCHSIVEDTLVMMVLGGHLSGILWARLVFSLAVVFLLGKMVHQMPEKTFFRFLFQKDVSETAL